MTDEEHAALAPIMVEMAEDDAEEPTPNQLRSHEAWVAVALVFGFNELAKQVRTLEEKAYCRLARSKAEESAKAYGVEKLLGETKVVLDMPAGSGLSVRFIESDIELMREAVAKFDREKAPR